jgi:5-methylcytosine-specific restriction endonuclease McrA
VSGRHDRTERRNYRRGIGLTCARCGFVAELPCQIDIHHADQDHQNHEPSNLVPLCANCHRWQTYRDAEKAPLATA